jgi:hypothetical protein
MGWGFESAYRNGSKRLAILTVLLQSSITFIKDLATFQPDEETANISKIIDFY